MTINYRQKRNENTKKYREGESSCLVNYYNFISRVSFYFFFFFIFILFHFIIYLLLYFFVVSIFSCYCWFVFFSLITTQPIINISLLVHVSQIQWKNKYICLCLCLQHKFSPITNICFIEKFSNFSQTTFLL